MNRTHNHSKNITESERLKSVSEKPAGGSTSKRPTSFGLNFLQLVSGSSIAALISLLATPILTRLYAPDAFGVMAIFISITAILGVLTCLRYEMAIVLPDNSREAANLLGVSICFAFIFSLLTVPFVILSKPIVEKWIKMPEIMPYLWLLPISIFIHGVFTALTYWNTRKKQFLQLSMAKVTNQLTSNSTSLGLGFAGKTSGGAMIIATILGKIIATAALGVSIWRKNGKFIINNIHLSDMLSGIRRYKKFPLYGSWSILLGVGAWQLPVLMMSSFFSPAIVGFYMLGFRIFQLPMNLVGNAIGQVFFQSAAEANAQGTLSPLVEDLFHQLVKICLFPMLMLTVIGEDLYIFILGKNWAEAGVYTQILSIWAFFWFLSGPFTVIFAVLEKQELQLKWNILNFGTRFVSILAGGYYQNPKVAIWLLAITGIAVYGYKVFITLFLARVPVRNALKILAKYTVIFTPAGVCIIFLNLSGVNSVIILLTAGIVCFAYIYKVSYRHLSMLRTNLKGAYANAGPPTIGVQGE